MVVDGLSCGQCRWGEMDKFETHSSRRIDRFVASLDVGRVIKNPRDLLLILYLCRPFKFIHLMKVYILKWKNGCGWGTVEKLKKNMFWHIYSIVLANSAIC